MRRVYNSRGHLLKLEDAVRSGSTTRTVYWEALEADASGRVVKERLGNGAERILRHDGETGRLEALTATRPGQTSGDLQDLRMAWDAAGNLTKREDLTGSRDVEESFTYDKLHRMRTSQVGTSSSNRRSFTYDGYGNLRSKAGVGTYAYFASTPAGWRRAGSDTFTYDADGSMLTGAGRTMTYDAGGRLKSAGKGSHTVRFVHGPDGQRIKREDVSSGTETTLYLGSVEKVTHADGTRTVRRRIGGMALEERKLSSTGTETSRATYYVLRDHLGSVSLLADSDPSDDAGAPDRERSYGPWGLRRNAGTWADLTDAQRGALPADRTRRGWTGHEMVDPVGLIHMNGRVYDPELGRFLQADPYVGDPSDILSLNRYAYAHGNPLANVDPSGHFIFELGLLEIVGVVLTAMKWIDAWDVGGGGTPGPEAFRDALPAGSSGWAFGAGSASLERGLAAGRGGVRAGGPSAGCRRRSRAGGSGTRRWRRRCGLPVRVGGGRAGPPGGPAPALVGVASQRAGRDVLEPVGRGSS